VGVVGPLLDQHEGWVQSPGSALAAQLAAVGTPVVRTSTALGRARRARDVAGIARRWRDEVDVVVVMVFSGRAFTLSRLGLWAGRRAGARTVAWLHGGGLPELAGERPDQVRATLAGADAVVAPTRWLADWSADLGVPAQVIPNGLDLDVHPFHERHRLRPRVLWMRTFQALYDPGAALEAFGLLVEERPDAVLTMAGQDKGLQAPLQRAVATMGLQRSVTFPGFLAGEAKRAGLGDHDVFLSTNRVDNAPVTLVEAGAAGLPVVATRVGGVSALVGGDAGAELVPPGDARALAGAIGRLLDDPDRATALSRAGRSLAEAHGWEVVLPRWQELFAHLAGLPPDPGSREGGTGG